MNDKVSGVGDLSFWEACSEMTIIPQFGMESYVFNHETDRLILPGRVNIKFFMIPPANTDDVRASVPGRQGEWVANYRHGNIGSMMYLEDFNGLSFGNHIFTFRSMAVSSPLEVSLVPKDLEQHASYVLDDFDQGSHDLLLNYSRFYRLKVNYPEDFNAIIAQAPILKIIYDSSAPYTIDFMADGELVMNEAGVSSAEGLPLDMVLEGMKQGEMAIRVRYKDAEKPYFGKIDLAITYKSGMVLHPPIEVVKVV